MSAAFGHLSAHVLITVNVIIAVAYFAISFTIAAGLRRTGQFGRRNPLGTATAAIFFSCGGGHALHAVHTAMFEHTAGSHVASVDLAIWDAMTAIVAITYWSLRRSYGVLLTKPEIFQDVERAEMQAAIAEAEERFRTAFDNAPTGMALVGADGTVIEANASLAAMAGTDAAELEGRPLDEVLGDGHVIRGSGEHVPVHVTRAPIGSEDGREVVQVEDLRAQTAAEARRAVAEQRFRTAFDAAPVGVAIVGLRGVELGRVLHANRAMVDMSGCTERELEGMLLTTLSHPEERELLVDAISRLRLGSERVQHEQRLMHADGNPVWTLFSAAAVRGENDEPEHAVLQLLDISDRKRFESQLRHMADHDPLTGLFNRRRFEHELGRAIAHARRYGSTGAVLIIDLDGFKYVNDSLGHSAGDELIVRVASVLRGVLRETDVLARIGGDEFAALLPQAGPAEATAVAEKLLGAVRRQAVLQSPGRHARITGSVGISAFAGDVDMTSDDVIAEADIAMYEAKGAGRDRVAVFDALAMRRERLTERTLWLTKLREALELDRLRLFAQPIIGIAGNGVARIELLLRYEEDDGTLVPPGRFLYLAERFDLIRDIDMWVLREAVRILRDVHLEGHELAVAVNVSAKTLADDALPERLGALLAEYPVPPGRLVIEITETAAISNIERAKEFADRLHRLGCRLALDDFGAGFASFYYLKHLAFDYVKIDGEFVRHLPSNPTDRLVIQAIVQIARGLGTRTVAEYVTDEETVQVLGQLGVDYGQGFHLGMPRPVGEVLATHVRGEPVRPPG